MAHRSVRLVRILQRRCSRHSRSCMCATLPRLPELTAAASLKRCIARQGYTLAQVCVGLFAMRQYMSNTV